MKVIGWNVDTQYDFMRPDGKLYVPGAELIEPKLAQLTDALRKNNARIVTTRDWHDAQTKEIAEEPDFATTFPEHCMAGTYGAENVEATAPLDPFVVYHHEAFNRAALKVHGGDIVLTKDHFNVFQGAPEAPYAEQVLRMLDPEAAVVYGVATNVCVDYAVRGLVERGVDVYVPTDAIKGLPIPGREEDVVIKEWEDLGARLVNVNDVAAVLEQYNRA